MGSTELQLLPPAVSIADTRKAGSERRRMESLYFFQLSQKLGIAQNLQSYRFRILFRSPGDLVSVMSFRAQTRPKGPPSTNIDLSPK